MITKTALDYLNSIILWGKPVHVGDTYHVKFHCGIEMGRKVYAGFLNNYPMLKIVFHVNKAKTHVTIGGWFPKNSGAYELLLQLFKDNKKA